MLQYKGDSLIDLSHKLDRIHKAALPNAIRFTLNDAARDVKVNTLSKHADIEFNVKKRGFFRSKNTTAYHKASGFKISKMQSVAGMIKDVRNKNSKATSEVGIQQFAGNVPNKSYIRATNKFSARGKSKVAKRRDFDEQINKKPIRVKKGREYIVGALKAAKEDRPLLVQKNNRKGKVVQVTGISSNIKRKRKIKIKTEILALYKEDRVIKLEKKRPFLSNAAIESGKKINAFYIKNAKKQLARFR